VLNESIVTHFHGVLWLHNVYCGFEYRFQFNKVRFFRIRTLPVISKDCFTYLWPNRQIIVGFFIKLSDSVLKSTESLNKSKGAVNTHINASSDARCQRKRGREHHRRHTCRNGWERRLISTRWYGRFLDHQSRKIHRSRSEVVHSNES
jgi:hypothetical protein